MAPFSTRARPGAPVSAPIGWDELNEGLRPDTFTVENLPHRLETQAHDPWAGFFQARQSITASMRNELNIHLRK